MNKEQNAQHFLELIKKSKRGKFKIYIGMAAGVGKTYRMLQEAHTLLKNGIDVKIGFIETHRRKETHALLEGLPFVPLRKLYYKGKLLEEMDLQAIINMRPEVVLIDELAHTNIEGSKNEKRWQDVLDILEVGINVISAVNIQHLESLNDEVLKITGVAVRERIPDSLLSQADEVVNIDLTSDELLSRLKEGKIYTPDKIQLALSNFFKSEHILQLRQLALQEVASQVERKVETSLPPTNHRGERFLACISSREETTKIIIRKTARLANYYKAKWFVLYVQTAKESVDKIPLSNQRHLINNFKLATELGAEIIKVQSEDIVETIIEQAKQHQVTTLCMGKPKLNWFQMMLSTSLFNKLLQKTANEDIDLIILSTK